MKWRRLIFLGFLMISNVFGSQGIAAGTEDSTIARQWMTAGDDHFQRMDFDSAAILYRKAGELWRSISPLEFVSSQIGIANALLRKGDYQSAAVIVLDADSIGIRNGYSNSALQGTLYTLAGYCFFAREDFPAAESYVLKSINILSGTLGGNHEKVGSALYTMGLIKKDLGDYPSAVSYLQRALHIQTARYASSAISTANTLTMIGSVYDEMNDFERAIDCYNRADTMFHALEKTGTTQAASCYLNLMSSLNNKGDLRPAIEAGKKVIAIYSTLGLNDNANLASALSKLGEVYANIGDDEKAKEFLLRSLEIFTRHHPDKRSAIGMIYQRLGDLSLRNGDLKNAIAYSEKGITLYQQALGEYHPQIGFMYELLAGVYTQTHQYDKAILNYQKALTARNRVSDSGSRYDRAMLHAAMARVFMDQGKDDSAFAHLTIAGKIDSAATEVNVPQRAQLRQRFGEYFKHRKAYGSAIKYFHSAINALLGVVDRNDVRSAPAVESVVYKKELFELFVAKAELFERRFTATRDRKDLMAAYDHYRIAMDVLDDVRKGYSSDASKLNLAERGSAVFRNGCRVAMQLFDYTGDSRYREAAFLIADRSKGNILLDRLFENDARHFSGIPDSLIRYEHEIMNEIAQVETQISRQPLSEQNENPLASKTQSRYLQLKKSHQDLVEVFEREYPKYYALKYASPTLTLGNLIQRMDERMALVEYMIDDDVIYAFTVTKKGLTVQTLRDSKKIRLLTQQWTGSLKTYDSELFCRAGFDLYSKIVRPVERSISGAAEVKIVPDGFLFHVPFEALPVKRYVGTQPRFSTMEYLISRYEISYSYSAAFTQKMNGPGESNTATVSSVVGFAPVFRDSVRNGDFFANRASVKMSGLSEYRSITLDGRTFNELKFSENEMTSIEQTMSRRNIKVKNYLFEAATEENFKQCAPLYDIVHVATHGFINEVNPKFSAIVFSQPSSTATGEDGILYVNETFNLNLKAKLVVLSSCESGVGKLIDGEGMIAFSRGLFYAGAQNIVFSLWKVSDLQTYQLMERFYQNIADGASFSSSLRTAKLSMIASPESAFPAKWSGFVILGQ